jgi:hypothetical protein
MTVVVDTNVAIVADRRAPQASRACVLTCTGELQALLRGGQLALDDQWLILKEYQRNLRPAGQPGVGRAFLEWVLTNRQNLSRCVLVPITVRAHRPMDFESFPDDARLSGFDPEDRKFVAVALAHPRRPPILQAVDSEWWKFRSILAGHGVEVRFLCPRDIQRLAQRKHEA